MTLNGADVGLRPQLRRAALAVVSGALAGVASFVFLESLEAVTEVRLDHPGLVLGLPMAGLLLGLVQVHLGGRATRGTGLVVEQIHEPTEWIPRRMAPLVYLGTLVSHLFGASVGREGTALQMSGSLTDAVSRRLHLEGEDRRILLVAAVAGGFGSVFGVPLAGAAFAIEVQPRSIAARLESAVPALVAAFVGDAVVGLLGHEHAARPQVDVVIDPATMARFALSGVVFGVTAAAFVVGVRWVRRLGERWLPWVPSRMAVAGALTVAAAAWIGRDALGLSLPLIDGVLAGNEPEAWSFAAKLALTVLVLGAGFPGGEVTPLFVIGATLGGALAGPLGLEVATLGAVGFVAVFAAAANAPLACVVMGFELFGAGIVVPLAVVCVVAHLCSGARGIYHSGPTVAPFEG